MNFKLRLKNKATLTTLITTFVGLVYYILSMFEIVPKVGEDQIVTACMMIVNCLALLGIVVDPTTDGIADSERALNYEEPHRDE